MVKTMETMIISFIMSWFVEAGRPLEYGGVENTDEYREFCEDNKFILN
jgi:hypothetical protein